MKMLFIKTAAHLDAGPGGRRGEALLGAPTPPKQQSSLINSPLSPLPADSVSAESGEGRAHYWANSNC